MKNLLKNVGLILTIIFMVMLFMVSSSALEPTGQCGDNVYWSYNSKTGELILSGSGPMWDYSASKSSPFNGESVRILNVKDNITSIGDRAFEFCQNLEKIVFPNTLLSIGNSFSYCQSLTDLVIPNSVTTIKGSAFSYCSKLQKVSLGLNLKNLGSDPVYPAFVHCENLTTFIVDNGNKYFSCDENGVLFDKAKTTLIQYPQGKLDSSYDIPKTVKKLRYCAFQESKNIVSITIPYGVDTIGTDAFYGCLSLENITIPNSVTSIPARCFIYCVNLSNIVIPNSVDSIGLYAFSDCDNLITVTIPNSVKYIDSVAFEGCGNLTEVKIGSNVQSIGTEVFKACSKLKKITVDQKNLYYASDSRGVLFDKNKKTLLQYPVGNTETLYTIPDGVITIGISSFYGNKTLKNVIIPDSVLTIEEYAFNSCDFANVQMGNNIKSIGDYAFAWNKSLSEIVIPDSVSYLGKGAFLECDGMKSAIIGNGVTHIYDGAFVSSGLCKLKLGENVTYIGENAFMCHLLTTVVMHNKVKSISKSAFYQLYPKIFDVYYYGTEEEWDKISFDSGNDALLNATLWYFIGPDFTGHVTPFDHTLGDWETIIIPSYETEGKKVKKCTGCGITVEEEIIPKLEMTVIADEKTGVLIKYPAENYNGKVGFIVKESFDAIGFNIIDSTTSAIDSKIYDIKMTLDGKAIQPNGKITVKIPLPSNYNPNSSCVYYININAQIAEPIKASYENGYMVFETDHFSYYAIVVELDADNCSCNCHKGGFASFFFKILNFFQKLFGMNKVCACGVKH